MHRYIGARIRALELDTSHFVGRGSTGGKRFPGRRRPLEEVLVKGSTLSSARLRARLVDAGLKEARCECCGLSEWQGEPFAAPARPHQRRPHRQPPREPPYPLRQLPLADGHVVLTGTDTLDPMARPV
jgi:hypothetical protein